MKNVHRVLIEMHHAGEINATEWAHLVNSVDELLTDWLNYSLGKAAPEVRAEATRTIAKLSAVSAALPITWEGQHKLMNCIAALELVVGERCDPLALNGVVDRLKPIADLPMIMNCEFSVPREVAEQQARMYQRGFESAAVVVQHERESGIAEDPPSNPPGGGQSDGEPFDLVVHREPFYKRREPRYFAPPPHPVVAESGFVDQPAAESAQGGLSDEQLFSEAEAFQRNMAAVADKPAIPKTVSEVDRLKWHLPPGLKRITDDGGYVPHKRRQA